MNTTTYNSKKGKLHFVVIFIAVLLLACGFVVLFQKGIIGFVFLLPGIALLTSYNGVAVDPSQERIQEYFCFMGIPFGKWEALQDYRVVLVRKINEVTVDDRVENFKAGAVRQVFFKVFLIAGQRKFTKNIYSTESYEQAMKKAEQLGLLLRLKVEYDEH